MSTKTQKYFLGALLGVLVLVTLWNWRSSPAVVGVFTGSSKEDRFIVQNPTLRLDLLEKISKLEYKGEYKDIFQYVAIKQQLPDNTKKPDLAQTPSQPAQPVPDKLVPPFKFYGFVVDGRTGRKRGFFTNGDDIWVAAEGDTIQTRFRLVKIGNTNAEVEEISTGRRATLPFEESVAPGM